MDIYQKAAKTVLTTCMDIQRSERLLIITDEKKKEVADLFLKTAAALNIKTKEIVIPVGKVNGEEPPNTVAEEMLKYPVQLFLTDKSLSHTAARKRACRNGARIASMPGVTVDMMGRALDVDYVEIKRKDHQLKKLLDQAHKVTISSELGTNLTINIQGRHGYPDDGIYDKPGNFGNLPAGEVAIGPQEGKSNGVYVIDASFAGIAKLDGPLTIEIKNGLAAKVTGKNAPALTAMFRQDSYRVLAELGIGTNPKAKITGIVLEDEKVLGTIHLALGNNLSFGGKNDVPLHVDGVMTLPTVYIDNKKILDSGKLLM